MVAELDSRNSMPNPKREFMWSRFRHVSCLLLLIAAGMAGFGAIGFSRAIGQRVRQFPECREQDGPLGDCANCQWSAG